MSERERERREREIFLGFVEENRGKDRKCKRQCLAVGFPSVVVFVSFVLDWLRITEILKSSHHSENQDPHIHGP